MLYFRPLPTLTVVSVALFAVLLALGAWQIERLQWKLGLIAQVDRNLHSAPSTLDRGTIDRTPANEYLRVVLDGRFDNSKEAYAFATDAGGAPDYHVIVPFVMGDGRVFLVDRGVVSREKLDPATRRRGLRAGDVHLVGVWRTPDAPGAFTPKPDLVHRIWYARDVAGIAEADGVRPAAPVVIEADATPNPGGWPKGGQTRVEFRNEHLQYAITWFGLAAVLLGVYIAYHVSRGRLGLR